MTKRAGKKKSLVRRETTGTSPVSPSQPKATGSDPRQDSFFWPELTRANEELAIKAGRGEQLKRLKDLRVEMRAVNERWPIPPELRERMVFESAKIAMDPQSSPKDKMWATRLLLAMDQVNTRPKDLPVQIQGSTTITVNQILAMIDQGSESDELDFRDHKVIPGDVNDYA